MPTSYQATENTVRVTRKVKKHWVALGLLLAVGYGKYAPPLNPPSSVFSDPAAEKRYFHNGRDGIVLHYANQHEAYLEAEWEYTGFDETYATLNVYRVFKGGWFRPTSKMLLYQFDAKTRSIDRTDGLFYRKGNSILLRMNRGVAKEKYDQQLSEDSWSR